MATSVQWQLAHDAAVRYEQILVPSILGPFARALVDWAQLPVGDTVLDVGCGTGAAARAAAERVGPAGSVTAVDVNPGMLDVARSLPPGRGAPITWREGSAYQLPLPDRSVEHVICAQTLQFLETPGLALAEMHRVLKAGGRVALSVWCPIRENPYFNALVDAVAHYIDPDTAKGLGAAFALTDADRVVALLHGAGFSTFEVAPWTIELDLPALDTFVPRHISATPMSPGYSAAPPARQAAVVADVAARLAHFAASDGQVRIPFRSYFVAGRS